MNCSSLYRHLYPVRQVLLHYFITLTDCARVLPVQYWREQKETASGLKDSLLGEECKSKVRQEAWGKQMERKDTWRSEKEWLGNWRDAKTRLELYCNLQHIKRVLYVWCNLWLWFLPPLRNFSQGNCHNKSIQFSLFSHSLPAPSPHHNPHPFVLFHSLSTPGVSFLPFFFT